MENPKLVTVYKSSDTIPFLIMRCDSVIDSKDGCITLVYETYPVKVSDYDYYHVVEVDHQKSFEVFSTAKSSI